ncbi:hypothetical protein [Breoghania sp.]|uniref:hypothetical protein n=1 Tax=Breoghania sp. TaxID=2065378 RepID=UPI002AA738AF|nr:hypothetical protein [Breoghania sp.]
MNERRFLSTRRTAFKVFTNHRRHTALFAGLLLVSGCAGSIPPGLVGDSGGSSDTPAPLAATVPASQATFAFEPFNGVPGNTADSLSNRLGNEAKRQGLTLVRRVGAPATYRVKGHLSAAGDDSSSTVIYVFDVYDANGRRVHRFSGQETASATSGDPWTGISGAALDLLAERTILALKSWLSGASG